MQTHWGKILFYIQRVDQMETIEHPWYLHLVYNAVASRIVSKRQGPSKDTRTLSVECPKVKSSSMASLC